MHSIAFSPLSVKQSQPSPPLDARCTCPPDGEYPGTAALCPFCQAQYDAWLAREPEADPNEVYQGIDTLVWLAEEYAKAGSRGLAQQCLEQAAAEQKRFAALLARFGFAGIEERMVHVSRLLGNLP